MEIHKPVRIVTALALACALPILMGVVIQRQWAGGDVMTKPVYDVASNGFVDGNDTPYDASWDGNPDAPSMHVIYHKIQSLGSAGGGYEWSIPLPYDGGWDDNSWGLGVQIPDDPNVVITKIKAYCVGVDTPTVTFQLEERSAGTINTTGSNIFSSYQTATAAGIEVTSFADPNMAAKSHLWFKTGDNAATGTVDELIITITTTGG